MTEAATPPAPQVRRHGGPSLVWLIPLLTVLIGGWLIYRTIAEKGPLVTVTFRTAEGLEIGKTRVKYKSLDIGVVEQIQFSEDFTRVEVRARLDKDAAHFLRRDTRFWVVKPQLGVRGVSGLSTLISGSYIEIEPGEGAPQTLFVGLEVPPVVKGDEAGRRIVLISKRLGSIDRGSQLYYQGIRAGEVLGYELANDYQSVLIHAFVSAPFDRMVRSSTRFWNASGVNMTLGADGVRVQTESLASLIFGGIAFDTPEGQEAGAENIDGLVFTLYDDLKSIGEQAFANKVRFVMFFEDSVRGLTVGAPVEFKGLKIGAVTDIRLEYDDKGTAFRIPVTVEIEPERIGGRSESLRRKPKEALQALVKRGLRARLSTGNLLTGQLFVELDMQPKAPLRLLGAGGAVPELPTLAGTFDQMANSVRSILDKVDRIDIEGIGADLRGTLKGANAIANGPQLERSIADLSASLASMRVILQKVEARAEPLTANLEQALGAARDAMEKTSRTMVLVEGMAAPDSPMRESTQRMVQEVGEAARAIRSLVELLERQPSSLIFGKKPSGGK